MVVDYWSQFFVGGSQDRKKNRKHKKNRKPKKSFQSMLKLLQNKGLEKKDDEKVCAKGIGHE